MVISISCDFDLRKNQSGACGGKGSKLRPRLNTSDCCLLALSIVRWRDARLSNNHDEHTQTATAKKDEPLISGFHAETREANRPRMNVFTHSKTC